MQIANNLPKKIPYEEKINALSSSLGIVNILDNTAKSKEESGLRFTVNEDKSVSVEGTSTATVSFKVGEVSFEKDEKYSLVGCPKDGDLTKYYLSIDSHRPNDIGEGTSFYAVGTQKYNVNIDIKSGVKVNAIFYPMVVRGAEIPKLDEYTMYIGHTDMARSFAEMNTYLEDLYVVVSKTEWVLKEDGKYHNIIEVNKVRSTDSPVYGLYSSTAPSEEERIAFMNVEDLFTRDGEIELVASAKPSVTFTIILKGAHGSGKASVGNIAELTDKVVTIENEVSVHSTKLEKTPILADVLDLTENAVRDADTLGGTYTKEDVANLVAENESLKSQVDALNNSILQMMEWKELGILRKENTLTLPSDFNELEIAIYTTNSNHAAVMRISKKNIDRLDFLSTCMWSQSNTDNYNYRFSIKNNEISLNAAKTGNTDITSSTNAHVLYR